MGWRGGAASRCNIQVDRRRRGVQGLGQRRCSCRGERIGQAAHGCGREVGAGMLRRLLTLRLVGTLLGSQVAGVDGTGPFVNLGDGSCTAYGRRSARRHCPDLRVERLRCQLRNLGRWQPQWARRRDDPDARDRGRHPAEGGRGQPLERRHGLPRRRGDRRSGAQSLHRARRRRRAQPGDQLGDGAVARGGPQLLETGHATSGTSSLTRRRRLTVVLGVASSAAHVASLPHGRLPFREDNALPGARRRPRRRRGPAPSRTSSRIPDVVDGGRPWGGRTDPVAAAEAGDHARQPDPPGWAPAGGGRRRPRCSSTYSAGRPGRT